MTIIAFGGWSGAGKDTAADIAVADHGFLKTFTSEPLLAALLKLNPVIPVEDTRQPRRRGFLRRRAQPPKGWVTYRELHDQVGYTASKTNPEVRRILRALGTEVVRDMLGEDLWVQAMMRTISTRPDADWAVTGIRYRNELQALVNRGAVTVWVDGLASEPANESDTVLSPADFDLVIQNKRGLEDLRQVVATVIGQYARPLASGHR